MANQLNSDWLRKGLNSSSGGAVNPSNNSNIVKFSDSDVAKPTTKNSTAGVRNQALASLLPLAKLSAKYLAEVAYDVSPHAIEEAHEVEREAKRARAAIKRAKLHHLQKKPILKLMQPSSSTNKTTAGIESDSPVPLMSEAIESGSSNTYMKYIQARQQYLAERIIGSFKDEEESIPSVSPALSKKEDDCMPVCLRYQACHLNADPFIIDLSSITSTACRICKKEFNSVHLARRHEIETELKGAQFECEGCELTFPSFPEASEHIKTCISKRKKPNGRRVKPVGTMAITCRFPGCQKRFRWTRTHILKELTVTFYLKHFRECHHFAQEMYVCLLRNTSEELPCGAVLLDERDQDEHLLAHHAHLPEASILKNVGRDTRAFPAGAAFDWYKRSRGGLPVTQFDLALVAFRHLPERFNQICAKILQDVRAKLPSHASQRAVFPYPLEESTGRISKSRLLSSDEDEGEEGSLVVDPTADERDYIAYRAIARAMESMDAFGVHYFLRASGMRIAESKDPVAAVLGSITAGNPSKSLNLFDEALKGGSLSTAAANPFDVIASGPTAPKGLSKRAGLYGAHLDK